MEHRDKLNQTRNRKWLTNHASYFQDFCFFLALLINFLITTGYEIQNQYVSLD
jgi:hypothetical protein